MSTPVARQPWVEASVAAALSTMQGVSRWADWRELDAIRQANVGRTWPAWAYLPTWAAHDVALAQAGVKPEDRPKLDVETFSRLYMQGIVTGVLASWRMTKSVYAFDLDLLEALLLTPVTDEIPAQLLRRLPEWCVFVATPEVDSPTGRFDGYFAQVQPRRQGGMSLVLLPVPPASITRDDEAPLPAVINLTSGNLVTGLEEFVSEWGGEDGSRLSAEERSEIVQELRVTVGSLLGPLLWLCSEEPQIEGKGKPGNPVTKRVKGGARLFPASGVRRWEVGVRVGAALRLAHGQSDQEREHLASGRARPRPHVRRAHWAIRWTGPKSGEQTPVLRWIAPTLVAADANDELPAVIRPVVKDKSES